MVISKGVFVRALTETEFIMLSNIWKLAPCTAYAVKKLIASSPVGRFSDSAGSIYPAIKRLIERQLVTVEAQKNDKRKSKILRCSTLGEAAIRNWLFDLDARTNFPEDPLRTRMIFLNILDEEERKEWLLKARNSLSEQMALIEQFENAEVPKDAYYQHAHRNSRLLIKARMKWLKGVT